MSKVYRVLPARSENDQIDRLAIINDTDGVTYWIRRDDTPGRLLKCSCPDFEARGHLRACKHCRALLAIERLIRELITSSPPSGGNIAGSIDTQDEGM